MRPQDHNHDSLPVGYSCDIGTNCEVQYLTRDIFLPAHNGCMVVLYQTRHYCCVAGAAQTIAQEAVGKVLEGRRYSHGKVHEQYQRKNLTLVSLSFSFGFDHLYQTKRCNVARSTALRAIYPKQYHRRLSW